MKKKSFLKLLLEAFGNAVLGNILALVVTISISTFWFNTAGLTVAAFCSVSLYFMCLFNVGYKDGEHERKLVTRKFTEKPEPARSVIAGLIIWFIYSVPCAVLLFIPDFLIPFRFAVSSMFALSRLMGDIAVPVYAPFIFIGIFALTPVIMRLGFYTGYHDKMTMESIIYKKIKKK